MSLSTGPMLSMSMTNNLSIPGNVNPATVTRDLGNADATTKVWRLTGRVAFTGTPDWGAPYGITGGPKVEILDATGKILATFFLNRNGWPDFSLLLNNIDVKRGAGEMRTFMTQWNTFSIMGMNGKMYMQFGDISVTAPLADITADWKLPKTLRFYFAANSTTHGINADSLMFVLVK